MLKLDGLAKIHIFAFFVRVVIFLSCETYSTYIYIYVSKSSAFKHGWNSCKYGELQWPIALLNGAWFISMTDISKQQHDDKYFIVPS